MGEQTSPRRRRSSSHLEPVAATRPGFTQNLKPFAGLAVRGLHTVPDRRQFAAERLLSWAADFPHGLDVGLVLRRRDGRIVGTGKVDHRLRRVRGRRRDRREPRTTVSAAAILGGVS